MTRAVIFDVGGVLIEWNPRHLYSKLLPDDAAIQAFLDEIGFHDWNLALDEGARWDASIAELAARHPHRRELIEAAHLRWHEMLPHAFDDSVAILEQLAQNGVPLYAITNFSSEKFAETRARFPFFAHFRDIVVSGDERLLKPEAPIYQLCLARNGLTVENCIFIDDNAANIAAATALGFDAIRFETAKKLYDDLSARGLLA
ncbi:MULTISPECIES: HAD-IA family hydrolase [Rhodomicrobium]|uniref:HAD-IA family hydrolase n=1 Tax=Rhodomicrobium TaxID=1068 RepID=UPI000B4BB7EC|nr:MULTISPECIES: HAD-IA family hydrolase [Rhodomicrobium]